MSQFANYINGEWLQGTSINKNINPSDISDVIGEYAQADATQTDIAISAAHHAFSMEYRKHPGTLRCPR